MLHYYHVILSLCHIIVLYIIVTLDYYYVILLLNCMIVMLSLCHAIIMLYHVCQGTHRWMARTVAMEVTAAEWEEGMPPDLITSFQFKPFPAIAEVKGFRVWANSTAAADVINTWQQVSRVTGQQDMNLICLRYWL